MNEQPLSLHASLQEIWRRRLLVISVAALCGLVGLAYAIFMPTNPSAVALVLLPPTAASSTSTGNSGAPGSDVVTDAVIATSTPVLAAAGATLSPPLGPVEVKKLVTVTPLDGQILQIDAQAATSENSVKLANAVAASYIDYVGQLQSNSAGPGVAALQRESNLLFQQIKELQTQINTVSTRLAAEGTTSVAGQQDLGLLNSLRDQQNQVSVQLNSVTSQLTSTQLAIGSTQRTTRILQPATPVHTSKYGLPIEASLIGFALGLLGACIYVLVRLPRQHRLRLRDEIALAAGAPVIASLDAPSCTTPSAWRELLESPRRAAGEWALRHVLHTLVNGGTGHTAVRVISFADDVPALTTGPRLALRAATTGIPTALVFTDVRVPENRLLAPLRATFTGAEPVGRGLPLSVGHSDMREGWPQLLVSIAVFDAEVPVASSDAINLLSISPNFATADELARLVLEASDHGSVLDGVVVVNPDPADTTSGLIGDTLLLLPARPHAGGQDELVRLGAPTTMPTISPERLSSREG